MIVTLSRVVSAVGVPVGCAGWVQSSLVDLIVLDEFWEDAPSGRMQTGWHAAEWPLAPFSVTPRREEKRIEMHQG